MTSQCSTAAFCRLMGGMREDTVQSVQLGGGGSDLNVMYLMLYSEQPQRLFKEQRPPPGSSSHCSLEVILLFLKLNLSPAVT